MGDILERKCAKCKKIIRIERNNIVNTLKFQDKYYHSKCFEELAAQKATGKRGNPAKWQDALDNIWLLEAETKKILEHYLAKDDLNAWLLENYNIVTVPGQFWQLVADLEGGKYKGKRCKPVDVELLCDCWKWGQKKLDEISQYNKSHNKGPTSDSTRLMYDLAILIGKVPQFLAYREKKKVAEQEMINNVYFDDIDMTKIGQGKQIKKKDVSDISDDIFTE